MPMMLLISCGAVNVNTSSGICKGLEQSIDDHAKAILDNSEKTPAAVIITGTRVIKGFDEGCKNK